MIRNPITVDSQELGIWLRQQREARCWARSEMARRLVKTAHANDDYSITDVDNLCHNIYRWEHGKCCPSERYRLYYCHALGISPAQFGVGKAEIEIPVGDPVITVICLLADVLGLRREFVGESLIIRMQGRRHASGPVQIRANLPGATQAGL